MPRKTKINLKFRKKKRRRYEVLTSVVVMHLACVFLEEFAARGLYVAQYG
jgi:hypothetical protein